MQAPAPAPTPSPTPSSQNQNQNPSRGENNPSLPTSATPGNAALKGATLAFQGQKTASDKPRPRSPTPTRPNNGAMRAAAQAARDHPVSRSRSPANTGGRQALSRQAMGAGGSGTPKDVATGTNNNYNRESRDNRDAEHGNLVAQKLSQHLAAPLQAGASPGFLHPGTKAGPDGKATSYIAAALAASRSGTPSPNHTGQGYGFAQAPLTPTQLHSRITRRPSMADSISSSSLGPDPSPPDTASIPPANSLISMFEGKKDDMDPIKKREPQPQPQKRPGPHPQIQPRPRPPTPPRSRSPDIETRGGQARQLATSPGKPKPKPKPKAAAPPPADHVIAPQDHIRSMTGRVQADEMNHKPKVRTVATQALKSSANVLSKDGSGQKSQPTVKAQPISPRAAPADGQAKPHVVPRKVKPVSKPESPAAMHPSTPPSTQLALSPAQNIVSPKPKRILKTPQLDPPTKSSTVTKMASTARPVPTVSPSELILKTGKSDNERANTVSLTHRLSHGSASSDDTFVSASSTQSPRAESPTKELDHFEESGKLLSRPALPARPSSSHANSSPSWRPVLRRPTAPSASTPNLALDSLTDAIMASNLASARLATAKNPRGPVSSGPPPMPPPRRHRARSPLHHHHHPLQQQRTADSSSPSRDMQHPQPSSQHTGMMQRTFRAPPTALSDDEEQRRHAHRHRKKTLGGKKHAHHEGSRRRWRDEVSVRERRRYEAVWASNRGLFLRKGWALQHEDNWKALDDGDGQQLTQADLSRAWDGPEAELVVNLVVRDIWSRSRLPKDELAEVWELVDRGRRGALDKQEFVVGMWLVDQRLRGRKIPARVGESVWESARGGMKVLAPPGEGKGGGGGDE